MKKIFIGVAALSILGICSCTKTILDVNSPNPNTASSSTAQLTTTLALENAARISQTSYLPFSEWLGYTATNGGFALDVNLSTYTLTSTSFNGNWQTLYLNISNWNYVKQQAMQNNLPLYAAIANVYEAYDFSCLVDLYNNVPYSDALLSNQNQKPIYDKGSDVYDSCIQLISDAITILNDPKTKLGLTPADNASIITFKGDLPDFSRWVRFANSLKLRLLINQSQVASKADYVKQQLATIDPNMLLRSGDDVTADPGYTSSSGKLSPYYNLYFSAPGQALDNYKIYHASNYALNFYKATSDPRISYFYQADGSGKYTGNDFGDPSPVSVSSLGDPSLNPTAPSVLMLSAEALFDQAEAIQRGWFPGDAKAVYQSAIEASFMYAKVPNPTSAAATYTSQDNGSANWDKASDKLQVIITQKWAALNMTSLLTVYNDYRRTGIPDVPLSIYEGRLANIPTRLIYPQAEYNLNAANVAAEGTINPITDKVFWDQ